MCLKLNKEGGWTLVELMVIIIIIAVLAVVVITSFANMTDRSREATTKGSLGALRSAISNFYADQDGRWPENLHDPQFNEYIESIPKTKLRTGIGASDTNSVTYGTTADSAGGWLYNSDTGYITVNHSGVDTKGTYYSTY